MSSMITCPACGKQYAFKAELAGKKVKCKCGHVIAVAAVPAPQEEQAIFDLAPDLEQSKPSAARQAAMPRQKEGTTCPSCSAPLATGSVICTECGFNLKTKQKMKGVAATAIGVPPGGRYPRTNSVESSRGENPGFLAQAARGSWMAPLIAFGLGMCTMSQRTADTKDARLMSTVIGICSAVLILTGLVLAIIALIGAIKKKTYRQVLAPAIVGLIINVALVAINIAVFASLSAAAAQKRSVARDAEIKKVEQEGEDAFLQHDGWYGVVVEDGVTYALSEMSSASKFIQDFLADTGTPCQLIVISIDNRRGSNPMRVDSARARLVLADGSSVTPIDPKVYFAAARKDRDAMLARFGQPRDIPAGQTLMDGMVLVPTKVRLADVAHVLLDIGPKTIEIPGRQFTAAEKQEMIRQAKLQGSGNPG